jgi:hypothetical protein
MKFFRNKNKRIIKRLKLKLKSNKSNSNNNHNNYPKTALRRIIGLRNKQITPAVSIINIYLDNCGLVLYLQSPSGGQRDKQSINQLLQRTELFLSFNHSLIFNNNRIPLSFNVEKFFSEIITNHYNLVPQFISHMEKKRSLSVSSQLNYMYDVQRSVHWFVLFRRKANKLFPVESVSYYRWLDCIRNIKKPLQHRLSLEKAKGNSLEEKVYQNEYPEGGLDQLQNCIKTEIEFCESLLSVIFIDEVTYRRFMSIVYSSVYSFGVQGRLAGNNYNT